MNTSGTAPAVMLNVVTGITALAVAGAGVVFQTAGNVVNLPVSVGSVLQLIALAGVGAIWWLVRGAFTDLRNRVEKIDSQCDRMAQRVSFIEGACTSCTHSTRIQRTLKADPSPPRGTPGG